MKRFFSRGMVALLPLVVTAGVLYIVLRFLWNNIGVPIGEAATWGLTQVTGKSVAELRQHEIYAWFFPYGPTILGFAVGVVLTFILGAFLATFLGRRIYHFFEAVLRRLPIVRVIYPYARQFTDFFFSTDTKMDFKHAVAIPYPRQGMYSIAFVTGTGLQVLNETTGKHNVSVFIPTSPTPISGYVCYLPREELIPLPITVEEAMRIIITCGVVSPQHQMPPAEPTPGGLDRHLPLPESLARAITETKPKG